MFADGQEVVIVEEGPYQGRYAEVAIGGGFSLIETGVWLEEEEELLFFKNAALMDADVYRERALDNDSLYGDPMEV
jgi:hypothetical protein